MKASSYLILIATVLIFGACNNQSNTEETVSSQSSEATSIDTSSSPIDDVTDFKFHVYLANIPSPFESIHELSKVELEFNEKFLNSPENESKYITTTKRALNFGVYGVDLAYLSANKKINDIPKYFATTLSLAKSLDVLESFDKVVGNRMEGNIENQDTISQIMDEAFEATDSYLLNNERAMAAVSILTGGWIESANIIWNSLKLEERNEKNEFLFKKYYEQRYHLDKLTGILKDYQNDSELKPLIVKMIALNEDFNAINSDAELTKKKVAEIGAAVNEIREMIVK